MMKHLYMLCGAAGSGKSTLAREEAAYEAGHSAIISRDRIRFSMVDKDKPYFSKEEVVVAEFYRQINEALHCEWIDCVYADATHLTTKARMALINSLTYPRDKMTINCIVVMPKLETTLKQNARRSGRECVPDTVIKKMYKSFVHPSKDNYEYDNIEFIEEEEV